MNKHHQPPHFVTPATAEQLNIQVQPLTPFEQMFLAFRRAHYAGMMDKPRSEAHRRFCRRELKIIDRQQRLGKGYTKIIQP